jgi:hypothetical protein
VPESGVRLTIAASIEAVSLVLAAARVYRRRAAEVRESRFAPKALGVVAGSDEKGGRSVGADPEASDELFPECSINIG